jgi:UDP-N-acetyl-D-mannosaminuronic acid transferase (WecB/TagA/CpsF family)
VGATEENAARCMEELRKSQQLSLAFEAGFLRASKSGPAVTTVYEPKARLVYVAMTSAKRGVDLPRETQKEV